MDTSQSDGAKDKDAQDSAPILLGTAAAGPPVDPPTQTAKPKNRGPKPHRFGSVWLMPTLIFLALGLIFAGLALTGKPIRLPVWAVAEAEQRLNTTLRDITGDAASLSLGGAVFVVDADWVPRLRLEDVRVLEASGSTLLALPELRMALDPGALATGDLRLRSLRLIGANMNLRRLEDGQFDLALGLGMQPRRVIGLSGVIQSLVAAFDHPALSRLRQIEAQALTLTIDDRMLGRVWDLGDGRLSLGNRAAELAVELGVSIIDDQGLAAQTVLTLIAAKADASARMTVTVDGVAAPDLAAQAAPLAWLGVLDARVSGQIVSALDSTGALSALDASLTLGKGALRPDPLAQPLPFDGAKLFFSYDPARERLELRELTLNSQEVAVTALGHAYLPGVTTGIPAEIIAQIQIGNLQLDPQGVLDEPVRFEQGAVDVRVALDPFSVDIGQAVLTYQGQRLQVSGKVGAGAQGWSVALDASLDQIPHDQLLALWPPQMVPKTRSWVMDNVQEGLLTNVRTGFRSAPGAEPRFWLGYDYSGADVRFLRTLPPIRGGRGYSVIDGTSYMLVLEEGRVAPPQGGVLDIAGSVFAVPDVTQRPARADIVVKAAGDLTGVLSLLDEPPFQFMSKARLPVDLGQGRATVAARIGFPLQKGVKIADVAYDVTGTITALSSDIVVPGRRLRADRLALAVTPAGMEITGKGTLQDVAFDGRFTKSFLPEATGQSQVTGRAAFSADAATKLGVTLPDGLITGQGRAAFTVDLRAGDPAKLALTSDLAGVGMAIPALGWAKPAGGTGDLALEITLAKPAVVNAVRLAAAGLRAEGSIRLTEDGGLDVARLSSVRMGDWLDVTAAVTGRGPGALPSVSVLAGRLDLRGLPPRGAGGARPGPPVSIALDRLTVTDGLSLTGFRSVLTPGTGGMAGDFTGRVNGQTPVQGGLAPGPRGTSVRIQSRDAGAVFSAVRIFPNAQGGVMDLILNPTGAPGTYDGKLVLRDIAVRNAPVLAELISAVSVVGLLEQMQGSGILFRETEATFRLSPRLVQVSRASAAGASLGVSLSGLYVLEGGRLDMQGVISPVYLLNGIGSFLTRKGEGLFGFNYRVTGTAKIPQVSVNPLSILTPGMFREIFRTSPPTLEPTE